MIYDHILVRYGDLTLKGKNKRVFLERLFKNVKNKVKDLDLDIQNTHDRIYISLAGKDPEVIIQRLKLVSGISSFSLVVKCDSNMDDIKAHAAALVASEVSKTTTFKVETRRSDKRFSMTSQEISKDVAGYVLSNVDNLVVDVHNPELTLNVDFRVGNTYLFTKEIKALGGYPAGIAGKGLLMLSGGIDSPVAGILAEKQGVEIECLHFESTPLTSIESAQKVVDLTKIMARYAKNNRIKVHMIPFKEIHEKLLEYIPDSYNITIMRRIMYKIADKFAKENGIQCLINGENVGQVASQTLGSMYVINEVTNLPIIRPVCTYDKNDIIKLAREFDTYNISIKPFEDCCTVYLPKAPATAPKIDKCLHFEENFDFEPLIREAIDNVNTIDIYFNDEMDLSMYALEVRDAIKEIKEERK